MFTNQYEDCQQEFFYWRNINQLVIPSADSIWNTSRNATWVNSFVALLASLDLWRLTLFEYCLLCTQLFSDRPWLLCYLDWLLCDRPWILCSRDCCVTVRDFYFPVTVVWSSVTLMFPWLLCDRSWLLFSRDCCVTVRDFYVVATVVWPFVNFIFPWLSCYSVTFLLLWLLYMRDRAESVVWFYLEKPFSNKIF